MGIVGQAVLCEGVALGAWDACVCLCCGAETGGDGRDQQRDDGRYCKTKQSRE